MKNYCVTQLPWLRFLTFHTSFGLKFMIDFFLMCMWSQPLTFAQALRDTRGWNAVMKLSIRTGLSMLDWFSRTMLHYNWTMYPVVDIPMKNCSTQNPGSFCRIIITLLKDYNTIINPASYGSKRCNGGCNIFIVKNMSCLNFV